MTSWWDPVDVKDWEPYAAETRGRRPKAWIQDPECNVWLRKAPPPIDPARPNTARRSEPAIEVFALELARRVGIEVASARPAVWGDARGLVSRRFHDADEEHHPGSELLGLPAESGSSPEARRRRDEGRASATLPRVRAKLKELEQQHEISLIVPFVRVLAVDAWLGNVDRHSGNWALITGPRGARLAPMYDPTACLGVELTDENPILAATDDKTLEHYANKCGSGFGGGIAGRTGVPMRQVLADLAAWPEWRTAIVELLPQFRARATEAPEILEAIPEDWLPSPRKRFAARLLELRVTVLSES